VYYETEQANRVSLIAAAVVVVVVYRTRSKKRKLTK
jgi:hypothetical protein